MFEGILSGGSIEIKTDKQVYALGETVNAEFFLKLNKTIKARALIARICAYETVKEMDSTTKVHASHHHHGSHTHTRRIDLFVNEVKLDGEKEYSGTASYKSSFLIPQAANLVSKPGFLGVFGGKRITWEITSKLDVSMAFDVNGRIELNVHE